MSKDNFVVPQLSDLIEKFVEEGQSAIVELYQFNKDNVYSEHISNVAFGLCCIKLAPKNTLPVKKGKKKEDITSFCQVTGVKLSEGGKHGVPYITNFNNKDKLIKVSKDIIITKPKNWGKLPPADIKALMNLPLTKRRELSICWLPDDYTETIYISLDEFTNETLIAGMIDYMWRTSKHSYLAADFFYPYVKHESAAICGDNITLGDINYTKQNKNMSGINLMEYCNMGNLADLPDSYPEYYGKIKYDDLEHPIFESKKYKPVYEQILQDNIARAILFHVIYAFHFLHTTLNFNHGDAKISNVFLQKYKGDTEIAWKENLISAPFCAKLADYGKSSATLQTDKGPVRLFWEPDSTVTTLFRDSQKKIHPFVPKVRNDTYETTDASTVVVYNRLRMMGIPYYKSYDVYMFLVSFFLQHQNYYTLISYPNFRKAVWDTMWSHHPESGILVENRIKKLIRTKYKTKELLGTGILIGVLKNTQLACNITGKLLNSLAKYNS